MVADQVASPTVQVKPRKQRSFRRWASAIVVLIVFGLVVHLFATNQNMRWDVVWQFLFNPAVVSGAIVTVELTVLGQIVAIVLGFVIALLRQSRNPVSVAFAQFYIWFFRAVPLIVQLLFWYNIAIVLPAVGFTIPFTDIGFQISTNDLISGFTAAILGLGLHEAAYMAEIIRAGTLSVPQGQMDAALSIGLERNQAMRRIVLPQTLRVIIPPTGNQFIGLLKASALVSVIGGGDLLTRVEFLYGQNFLVIPLLVVATIWYVALVSVFSIFQYFLEAGQTASLANAPSLTHRIWTGLMPIVRRRR